MADYMTTCSRCGGNAAYVQEVNENIKNYICYGCGFQTNTLMKKGEEFFEQQMELLPDLYKELMGEDEDGKICMPTVINLPNKGMVFANGTNASNWRWSSVKAVPVKEEEKEKYPIPGKKGEYYEWRMDMSTITHYNEKDFVDALDFIGIFDKQEG
jgi:hypothetical protein